MFTRFFIFHFIDIIKPAFLKATTTIMDILTSAFQLKEYTKKMQRTPRYNVHRHPNLLQLQVICKITRLVMVNKQEGTLVMMVISRDLRRVNRLLQCCVIFRGCVMGSKQFPCIF